MISLHVKTEKFTRVLYDLHVIQRFNYASHIDHDEIL